MNFVEEKKKQRFLFLKRLYEIVDGHSSSIIVKMFDLGEELGMNRQETSNVVSYLEDEGLIESKTIGGGISITHFGVKEVERSISNPDKSTEYFPPINVIQIGNMINSNIQQSSNYASQTVTNTSEEVNSIVEFLKELKNKLPEVEVSKEDRQVIESDITSIESQIGSPRPKQGIVKECLKSIRTVLEGAVGSIAASGLLAMFPNLPN